MKKVIVVTNYVELLKKFSKSGLGIMSSVIGTVIIFLLLARQLGPSEFGVFSTSYAVCSIISIVFDYGYQARFLRGIGCLNGVENSIPKVCFLFKLIVFFVLTIIVVVIGIVFKIPLIFFVFLWCGFSFLSFGNFLSASLKNLGYHGLDSINLLISNVIGLLMVLIGNYLEIENMSYYGFVYIIIGSCYFLLSLKAWVIHFRVTADELTMKSILGEAKEGFPYAFDAFTIRGFSFFDVIILSMLTSSSVVGIYQAAQKCSQAFLMFIQVFNNVILPSLSRDYISNSSKWIINTTYCLTLMSICGLIGCVFLYFFGGLMVSFLFGEDYAEAESLLLVFGLVVLFRYIYGALGIAIVSSGMQKEKTKIMLISFILFVIFSPVLTLIYDSHGMVLALAFSSMVSSALLFLSLRKTYGNMEG